MSGFIPIPKTFESVYAHVEGYGRTKSASYRNWVQARGFVYGAVLNGYGVRRAVAILRAARGDTRPPAWWKPWKRLDRQIPAHAPPAVRFEAAKAASRRTRSESGRPG